MLDVLNERLVREGDRAIAFDSDCREGICGTCSLLIGGTPHGPKQVTTCQLFMREFEDGAEITVEPFRATAFPVVRDLVTDRSALDRIVQAGGYVSVTTGPKPEPNSMPVHPEIQQEAMTRRSASAAAPVSPPARTARPHCSPAPRSPTSTCCRRASPRPTTA